MLLFVVSKDVHISVLACNTCHRKCGNHRHSRNSLTRRVLMSLQGENSLTEILLQRLNSSGTVHMVPASLQGRYVIRSLSPAKSSSDSFHLARLRFKHFVAYSKAGQTAKLMWRGGATCKALDLRSVGRGFKSSFASGLSLRTGTRIGSSVLIGLSFFVAFSVAVLCDRLTFVTVNFVARVKYFWSYRVVFDFSALTQLQILTHLVTHLVWPHR